MLSVNVIEAQTLVDDLPRGRLDRLFSVRWSAVFQRLRQWTAAQWISALAWTAAMKKTIALHRAGVAP